MFKKIFYKDGKINREIIVTATSIFVTILLVISTSYAAFVWDEESENTQDIISGAIGVSITNTSGTLTLTDAYPKSDNDGKAQNDVYSFTVTNTTSNPVFYTIKLVSDTNAITADECSDNLIDLSYIKWYTTGTVNTLSTNNEIATNIYLDGNDTKSYNLRVWLSSNAPNDAIGAHFHGKIVLEYRQFTENDTIPQQGTTLPNEGTLARRIIDDNSPVVTTTPDFSQIPTTDEGLIKGTDADGDTYYFRGAVQDNYLKIQGLTWGDTNQFHSAGDDVLFRIVRINGSGTTRIIMNEPIGSTAFNTNYNNEKYVGYTYDNGKSCTSSSPCTSTTGTPSTIKDYLENASTGWYTNNMAYYDSILATERYCNDTSVSSTSGSNIYYGAYGRLYTNNQPQFTCPDTTKTYGGEYNLKVGLLSADEAVFAGGKHNTLNISYYLNDILHSQYVYLWLGSPFDFDGYNAHELAVNGNNYIDYNYPYSGNVSAVPVFNLNSDILYSSGSGQNNDPYVVEFATTHQITANSVHIYS